ncbi:hypothetical protein ACH5RR_003154 [Cinchona calisaya]|uniref:Small ribosomal subunit protein uS3 C-terminal domain-containing protein n=1 Tax=Cinchona calisaya TaxID=153742 RepID=A0ABD3AUD2_9GENT
MRSLLSNRTNTNTLIESVKIKSVYQSASPIAQDISFQPKNKTRSFRSIFSKIVKDIPLVMKKGVEGVRICCSGRLKGAEIARTECGKYGKTPRNVFNQKIDYAPVEVSTRYGISGRCSRRCKPDGTQLGFGRYGTKSCRAGCLSYRAIEAARRAIIGHFYRAMSGQFLRNGKIWVRVLADLPITGKPTEVRMGRGKGNPTGWVARVSTGQILFEMDGVTLSNARQAATLAAHKPSSSTNQALGDWALTCCVDLWFLPVEWIKYLPSFMDRVPLSVWGDGRGAGSSKEPSIPDLNRTPAEEEVFQLELLQIEKQKGQLAELIRPLIEEDANKSQSIRTLPSPRDFVEELINRSRTPLVQKVNYDHNHEDLRYLKIWLTRACHNARSKYDGQLDLRTEIKTIIQKYTL